MIFFLFNLWVQASCNLMFEFESIAGLLSCLNRRVSKFESLNHRGASEMMQLLFGTLGSRLEWGLDSVNVCTKWSRHCGCVYKAVACTHEAGILCMYMYTLAHKYIYLQNEHRHFSLTTETHTMWNICMRLPASAVNHVGTNPILRPYGLETFNR